LAIVIQPYRKEHEPAVADFNQRLQSAGADRDLVFFSRSAPRWLPVGENKDLYNEFFVALEGDVVRGGYALKHQSFSFAGANPREVSYYHHPLSEGIVNKAHATVGGLLLRDAMQRSPLLYCLGMGGYDRPLPKMLVRLGWSHCLVPLYFRVVRPTRFLREMQVPSISPLRKLVMDVGAFSGAGWAAWKAFDLYNKIRAGPWDYQVDVVDEFGDWVNPLWENWKGMYAMTAVRDATTLRTLYPATDRHFTRLRVRRKGADIGLAVVGEKRADPKYGSLRVGSIVDSWASPDNAAPVIQAATKELEHQGMDLIVSNHSHSAWCAALRGAGFLKAESNFIFAASKRLSEALQPFEQTKSRVHFTRADGDGLPRNF
jgi:hypothetical protein